MLPALQGILLPSILNTVTLSGATLFNCFAAWTFLVCSGKAIQSRRHSLTPSLVHAFGHSLLHPHAHDSSLFRWHWAMNLLAASVEQGQCVWLLLALLHGGVQCLSAVV